MTDPESPRAAEAAGESAPAADPLPPDPAAFDTERNAAARARGLSAPYIAGGRDPVPDTGLREERFYGRLLLIMFIAIVLGGFVLGALQVLLGLGGG
jgi:hypothetical protein